MKSIIYVLVLPFFLLSCDSRKETSLRDPNIVLILADDLGYGGLSCYGDSNINTPNLDLLAAKGVRFLDFHSNGSVCSPTRAALMTGKYQQRTGVGGVITAKSHREVGLDLNEITIAEEFKKHGYNTGMFGKWHLGYSKKYNPTLQGFDDFVGFVSGNVDYHGHIDQEGYLDWWKGNEIANEDGYTTDLITNYGVQYILDNDPKKTGKPFFLYLPHEAPHAPYQKRIDKAIREVGNPKTRRSSDIEISVIYKEMVEVMDEGIGQIIQTLKETKQYENTIVFFISDNGGNRFGNNGGLRGHKAGVYEGGSRVPAIFSFPSRIKKAQINNQMILTMDVLPTLLDFIGQEPSSNELDGISIKANLMQQINLQSRDAYFEYGNKSFVRSGDWKLISVKKEDNTAIELFDLSSDITESNDLSLENPALVNSMTNKLTIWKKDVKEGVDMISK